MDDAMIRLIGCTFVFVVGCNHRVMDPRGTWESTMVSDLVLELREDGKFTFTHRTHGGVEADPRDYEITGTFDYNYGGEQRSGTFGDIDFFVEGIELEGTMVDEFVLEPDDDPELAIPIRVDHEMVGFWQRDGIKGDGHPDSLYVEASCFGPRPTYHDSTAAGDCLIFNGHWIRSESRAGKT